MKTIKMRKEDWEKWDNALRSGEYAQGQSYLCNFDENTFCCLGVLQHCLTGETETWVQDPRETNSACLPSKEWLARHKIKFKRPEIGVVDSVTPYLPKLGDTADSANDDGKSFTEIADAIKDCVEFIEEEKV